MINLNRKVVFICIALGIFTLSFLLLSSDNKQSKVVKTKTPEPQEVVYVTKDKVNKSQLVTVDILNEKKVNKSEVELNGYITKTVFKSLQVPRFRADMGSGEFVTKSTIATPLDEDYVYLLLNEDETTYFYEMNDPMQVLNLRENSNVDFVFRGASNSVVKVIINNVQVVKVINKKDKDIDNSRNLLGLIVALSVNDILKLKAAETFGEVSVIKSSLSNDSKPFDGNSLITPRRRTYAPRRIKELRGK
ncbi:CpaB family protein [Vibrio parahaemolyticus]|uniref:hypothetical protein n=1 Tax=Vibrio parahaemolyticus TaxID=670 RepID=UPI0038916D4B